MCLTFTISLFSMMKTATFFWSVCFFVTIQIASHSATANQEEASNVKFPSVSNSELIARSGKHEYDVLMERKRTSPYGQCWADAIAKLERSCTQLSEDIQAWLVIVTFKLINY